MFFFLTSNKSLNFFVALRAIIVYIFDVGWSRRSRGNACPREDWGMSDDFSLVPRGVSFISFTEKFQLKSFKNRVASITGN